MKIQHKIYYQRENFTSSIINHAYIPIAIIANIKYDENINQANTLSRTNFFTIIIIQLPIKHI